jgi:hypothetical protein
VTYPGGQLGLVPLGLTLVPAVAIYRSARRLAAEPLLSQGFSSNTVNIRPGAQAVLGLAASYAVAATAIAVLVGSSQARPVLWQAPIGPGLLALLAGALGVVRGHPRSAALRAELASWLPARVRSAVRPALLGAAVVLLAGFVVVVVALVTSGDRVLTLHRALRPDGFGGALLVAGQVGYLPDLAAWAVTWLAGPGFALGAGSVVAPGTVHLGVLPVVPVLGALPTAPLGSTWTALAPAAAPVLAGIAVGWWSVRRAPAADLGSISRLLDALGAVVVAALLLAAVVALSAGPIGPGRLADVGANTLVVTPFLALELTVGALPAAAAAAWWRRRSSPGPVVPQPPSSVD